MLRKEGNIRKMKGVETKAVDTYPGQAIERLDSIRDHAHLFNNGIVVLGPSHLLVRPSGIIYVIYTYRAHF